MNAERQWITCAVAALALLAGVEATAQKLAPQFQRIPGFNAGGPGIELHQPPGLVAGSPGKAAPAVGLPASAPRPMDRSGVVGTPVDFGRQAPAVELATPEAASSGPSSLSPTQEQDATGYGGPAAAKARKGGRHLEKAKANGKGKDGSHFPVENIQASAAGGENAMQRPLHEIPTCR